jgi:hypothetical protein
MQNSIQDKNTKKEVVRKNPFPTSEIKKIKRREGRIQAAGLKPKKRS